MPCIHTRTDIDSFAATNSTNTAFLNRESKHSIKISVESMDELNQVAVNTSMSYGCADAFSMSILFDRQADLYFNSKRTVGKKVRKENSLPMKRINKISSVTVLVQS